MKQTSEQLYKPPLMIPPVWLVLVLAGMYALDRWLPLIQLWGESFTILAKILVYAGLALDGWGAVRFLMVKTGLIPFTPVKALVKTGPYRFSRNPMYIGMLMLSLGAAIHFGSLSPFLLLPVFFLILRNRFVIPEEAMLSNVIGKDYLDYLKERRRWL